MSVARTSHRQIVRGSEGDMTVGEIVRQCRWKKEWSIRTLSEKSGVARQTITDAEYGRRGTSVAVLLELLHAMEYELIVSEKTDGEQTKRYRKVEAVIDKIL